MEKPSESTPLMKRQDSVSSNNTNTSGSNYYFVKQDVSATVENIINPLGQDGEPSSEEVVNVLPKNTVRSEFGSRPVFASPKRRSSADRQLLSNPTDKVIQFFSSVFSRNNTNSTTTTTNGLSERKRVVISGIPAGIGNTGPGTQVKQRKVPIKVDPKVYFANERTFLAWLHISVILSSASIAIMALAKENTWSVMYGIILLPVAVSFLVYAMVQYMRRAAMIRRRDPGPYEAIVGPTILTIMLMISIVMQFTVKLYSIEAY